MKNVLIVDDELDIVEALKAILEEERYQVVTCGNGREALRYLQEARPDLAIMDIMMPGMNGYEALKAIRQRHELDGLPVLLMSAITPAVKGGEYACSGFLQKPFSLQELLERVHQLAPKDPDQEDSAA